MLQEYEIASILVKITFLCSIFRDKNSGVSLKAIDLCAAMLIDGTNLCFSWVKFFIQIQLCRYICEVNY